MIQKKMSILPSNSASKSSIVTSGDSGDLGGEGGVCSGLVKSPKMKSYS